MNEYFGKSEQFKDMMYTTYTHDKIGSITLGHYTPEKVSNYINNIWYCR